ncbi:MAG: DUF4038 domain-containing protein, partial [Actinobacteria bacterium]|nr:DUF4038 domain-containing protein [Actinomycetota bacterium]
GEQEWRVRFSPRMVGEYACRTECSDRSNPSLHDQRGILVVQPYEGNRPLAKHGPLRASASGHHLEHVDGTPFFALADLWWLGASRRLSWPEGFQRLTADRVAKGFNVVQLIAGLPCDMPAFDERAANEAGHPWEEGYARVNPAFFDMLDLRIQWLVRSGVVPCIYGAFGYHLLWMGVERMKQHWRYLVARYGAYPVLWCLAGCVPMPYYLSQDRDRDAEQIRSGWAEVASYLRRIDPYGHPALMQPLPFQLPLDEEASSRLLDVYLLHTGAARAGRQGRAMSHVREIVARQPRKPVLGGESGFEGLGGCTADDHRFGFWAFVLSGVVGYTYSAAGIWQFNNEGDLFGPSAYGITQSNTLWMDACHLPGSRHVGLGRRLLERYPWWRFESHPEWVEPHADDADPTNPYAAGIPGQVRVIYLPRPALPTPWGKPVTVVGLEPGATYRGFFFDPKEGAEYDVGPISGCSCWAMPAPPLLQDWVLVLEQVGAS